MGPDDVYPFEINATVEGDQARVVVGGELDITTAPGFIDNMCELAHDGVRSIAVDCGGVEFLDSAGVRAFVVSHNEAEKVGVHFAIVDASASVRRVLDMTGLTPILT